jgi:branched-chain amino acid transport system substrate-binding protein
MISAIGVAMVPLANDNGVLLLSPTVTTSDLTGLDDQFFRIISSSAAYAQASAAFHTSRSGWRRFALVRDEDNVAYTHSWTDAFAREVNARGGDLVAIHGFQHDTGLNFPQLAQTLLDDQADAVVIVAGAVDTARLAQALRKRDPKVQLIGAEWSATEQLLALGGRALDGMYVGQFYDKSSQTPTYKAFVEAFQNRFSRAPGYAEMAAYDAAQVLLQAMAAQQTNETLKSTLLRIRRFDGVQQPVEFDPFGDSRRDIFINRVENGAFSTTTP